MLAGDYEEEHRTMLEGGSGATASASSRRWRSTTSSSAAATPRHGRAARRHRREFIANLRADGLILASPTGSTAYALSAGGPILHPSIAGWVLAPIASHGVQPPIVLPDDGEVTIEIVAGRTRA